MTSVLIATPSYDARLGIGYVRSLFETGAELNQRSVSWGTFFLGGNALIEDARHDILAVFMESSHSHLLMADSDISWGAGDVSRLLDHREPFVAGAYLRRGMGDFAVLLDREIDEVEPDGRGLVEVAGVGAGFVLVHREAIQKLWAHHPELVYQRPDGRKRCALFLPLIQDGEMLAEDYSFCARWREIGGKVFVDPLVKLRHHMGSSHVEGCLADSIPSLRERKRRGG